MNKRGNMIFIGIADSGKSSFIAALWHVVESKEIADSLKITSLPAQREYLNELRKRWQSCKKLTRNVGDFKNEIVLKIELPAGEEVELVFPDLAGEIYESHFATRQMKEDFVDRLHSTSDIVLFINPDNLKKGDKIQDANFLDDPGAEDGHSDQPEHSKEPTEITPQKGVPEEQEKEPIAGGQDVGIPWDPKFAPTQVVIVDLLQMILEYVKNPKVAVVISAWDLILNLPENDTSKKHPPEWLKANVPLLSQYLETNQDQFESKIFGVSAQGGSYKEDKERLLEEFVQSDRINVQLENGEMTKDISSPIKWILDVAV